MRRLSELPRPLQLAGGLALVVALFVLIVVAMSGGSPSDNEALSTIPSLSGPVAIVPTTDLPKPVILGAVPTAAAGAKPTPYSPPGLSGGPEDPTPISVPDLGGLFGDGVLSYPPVSTNGWLTYTNESFGFSFKYPPGWLLDTTESVPPDYLGVAPVYPRQDANVQNPRSDQSLPQDVPCLNCATFPKVVSFDVSIQRDELVCSAARLVRQGTTTWHGQEYETCLRMGQEGDDYADVQFERSWPDVEGKGLSLGIHIRLTKGRAAAQDRVAILVAIFESLTLQH